MRTSNAWSDTVMSLNIRQIREEDVPSFNAAIGIIARERRYLYLIDTPPMADTAAMVARTVKDGTPHHVLVDGDRVVGWCNILPPPRPARAHVGIVAMGLLPEWRDKGWGTRLMQSALAAANAFGFTRVELTVFANNLRAQALYRKLGFVEEGIKRDSVRIDDVSIDEIIMARRRPAT